LNIGLTKPQLRRQTSSTYQAPLPMIDDPNKELSSTSYKQQKLPAAAYEALKKSGFNFKRYEKR
jgi:hypothetical protein